MKNVHALFISSMLLVTSTSFAQEESSTGGKGGRLGDMMTKLDTDGDGRISVDEFSAFSPKRGDPEEMFSRIGQDGDGFVTEEEMKQARKGMRGKRKGQE
ncbi:EF-hand domain-containing protein [Microbulbifer elongatus]|uniref:EF-hand domain-containing protein n=1 Tax=Microbulbifer elongatus TaxID=86173 RepID=UPI001E5D21BA|nr:EF-hand domain-containing protein [Microbulbifer elongatus]